MKTTSLTAAISVILIFSFSQLYSQSGWNIGIQPGPSTNLSIFGNGNEEASALFGNNMFHGGQISVLSKYHFTEKKAIETGIILSQFGFSYTMSKNYSLKKAFERNEEIKTEIGLITIPVMAVIHTRRNCSNVRFVFGIGAAAQFIENISDESRYSSTKTDEDGNSRTSVLTANTSTTEQLSGSLIWKIGIEKLLKRGGALTFTYTGNQGLNKVAESDVTYNIDGNEYRHQFINRASFVNLAIGYQFRTFGSKKNIEK
jgi:hypothetical protein